jgi:hypothetical protein
MAGWLRRMRRLTGADQACPLKIDEEATAYVAVSAFKRAAISAICVGHTKLVMICMASPKHTTRYATELLRQPHAKKPTKADGFRENSGACVAAYGGTLHVPPALFF